MGTRIRGHKIILPAFIHDSFHTGSTFTPLTSIGSVRTSAKAGADSCDSCWSARSAHCMGATPIEGNKMCVGREYVSGRRGACCQTSAHRMRGKPIQGKKCVLPDTVAHWSICGCLEVQHLSAGILVRR